jgi:hypothetical protein
MPRDRLMPSDFWTWEAVIDCAPMTRLLFIGLWTFADDFGVQPLRPRTLRMQVFPGDAIDTDAVRAMLDELAAQGLVRLYAVDGVDYVAIVDWHRMQRVGKRARRRYPAEASTAQRGGEVGEQPSPTRANQSNAADSRSHPVHEVRKQSSPTRANQSNGRPPPCGEVGEWPSRTMANHSNGRPPTSGEAVERLSRTMANHSNVESPSGPQQLTAP